jgi:hypothetical protein
MAEHLAKCDKLSVPRQFRFPKYFEDDVKNLVRMFVRDIVDKYDKVRHCSTDIKHIEKM